MTKEIGNSLPLNTQSRAVQFSEYLGERSLAYSGGQNTDHRIQAVKIREVISSRVLQGKVEAIKTECNPISSRPFRALSVSHVIKENWWRKKPNEGARVWVNSVYSDWISAGVHYTTRQLWWLQSVPWHSVSVALAWPTALLIQFELFMHEVSGP